MLKDELLKVPKLLKDGSNWVIYRERLRWALDARGVLGHIESAVPERLLTPRMGKGKEKDDATGAEEVPETEITDGQLDKVQGKLEQWVRDEAVAKQAIASTLPDSVFSRIRTKQTAKEVWEAVVAIFEERSFMLAGG